MDDIHEETQAAESQAEVTESPTSEASIDDLLDRVADAVEEEMRADHEEEDSPDVAPAETVEPAGDDGARQDSPAPLSSDDIVAKQQALRDEFNARKQQLKEQRQLEQQRIALQAQQQRQVMGAQQLKELAHTDFDAFLEQVGLTPQGVATRMLDGKQPEQAQVPKQVEDKLALLEQQNQQLRQYLEQRSVTETRQRYLTQTETLLGTEKYALLSSNPQAAQQVLNLAVQYAQETGQALPVEQALDIMQGQWQKHLVSLKASTAAREFLGLGEPAEPKVTSTPAPQTPQAPSPRELASAAKETPKPDNIDFTDEGGQQRGIRCLDELESRGLLPDLYERDED